MISTAARNVALASIGRMMNGGALCIFSDTGEKMTENKLSTPAFSDPLSGEIKTGPIASSPVLATGKAARFAIMDTAGNEVVTGTVGASGAHDIAFPSVAWTRGEIIEIDHYTIRLPG